eukprot:TRINITY_DN779_c0_g1_i15.p1 TRINITY_DN779_c0_g1~~TRINITY_DN779_c0_g1_i15.p1  ORF type:complete len:421 (+),score=71.33 TRINITY_DN779_c0_g1_i15:165-1265(+)
MVVLGFLFWKPQPDLEPWYIAGDMDNIYNMRTRNSVIALTQDFCSNGLTNWKWSVTRDINLYFHTTFLDQRSDKEIITVLVIHGGPGIPYPEPWKALQMVQNQSRSEDKYKYCYRFIYYHQRGSGNSTRLIDTFDNNDHYKYKENLRFLVSVYGLQEHIADLSKIREMLETDKYLWRQDFQLLIVGHGFGGFLATLFAAEYPDQVKGMVLVKPTNLFKSPVKERILESVSNLNTTERSHFDEWKNEYLDFTVSVFKKSEKQIAQLNAKFFEFWRKSTHWDMPSPPLDMVGGWVVYGMYLSMGLYHDYTSVLKEIEAPVLVCEENDESFYKLLTNGDVKIVPNNFQEAPEFVNILANFLISLSPTKK